MNSSETQTREKYCGWIFRTIPGTNPDPEKPGYEHIILRPQPGGSLTRARGHYDSIRGRIAMAWRLEDKRIHLDVDIPVVRPRRCICRRIT